MKKAKEFTSIDDKDNEITVLFKSPNQDILTRGDFVYRTEFSRAVRSGIMTAAEANKLLRERGIWDDEREAQESELRVKIAELEKKLEDASGEDGLALVEQIKKERVSLQQLTNIYGAISENTAESVASEARTQFFASECSVYKDGGRVFKSYEDFKKRLDEQITVDCYRHALISNWEEVLGVSIEEMSDQFPEDEWLSKNEPEQSQVTEKVETPEPEEKPKKTRRKRKKKAVAAE